MILDVLDKLRRQDYNFTAEELPAAVKALPHLCQKENPEKLLPIVRAGDAKDIANAFSETVNVHARNATSLTPSIDNFLALMESSGRMREILTANNCSVFRNNLHLTIRRPDLKMKALGMLIDAADKAGGKELLTEMVRANDFEGFRSMCKSYHLHASRVQKVMDIAKRAGGDTLVQAMLTANQCEGFHALLRQRPESRVAGDSEPSLIIFSYAHSLGNPGLMRQLLEANHYETLQIACGETSVCANAAIAALKDTGDKEFIQEALASNNYGMLAELLGAITDPEQAYLRDPPQDSKLVQELLDMARKTGKSSLGDHLLAANDFEAPRLAAQHSQYPIFELLLKNAKASSDKAMIGKMATANDNEIIKKLCSDDRRELIQSIVAAARDEDKRRIVSAMPANWRQVFETESGESADLRNTPQTVRALAVADANLWKAVTRQPSPHPMLTTYSPKGFKHALYDELLPLMEMDSAIQRTNDDSRAAVHAYKLAVMFANKKEAERYLDTFQQRKDWNHGNTDTIHDALLFSIPQGDWDINRWKGLLLKHGPAMSKYFGLAPKIEQFVREHDKPFPSLPSQVADIAAQVSYARGKENPEFAKLALSCGVSEEAFNESLDILKSVKSRDKLPEIFIDGTDVGHPNFYMEKVKPGDPVGLVLGKLTNCCQHLEDAGRTCTLHGMTSENGGFYVWKHKTKGRRTPQDDIVAQSWAWLGTDNALVFDSFERLGPAYNQLAKPFLEQLAHDTVDKHTFQEADRQLKISAIKLGAGGAGGAAPEMESPKVTPSHPKDYNDYSDAKEQYAISPINHRRQERPRASTVNNESPGSARGQG